MYLLVSYVQSVTNGQRGLVLSATVIPRAGDTSHQKWSQRGLKISHPRYQARVLRQRSEFMCCNQRRERRKLSRCMNISWHSCQNLLRTSEIQPYSACLHSQLVRYSGLGQRPWASHQPSRVILARAGLHVQGVDNKYATPSKTFKIKPAEK